MKAAVDADGGLFCLQHSLFRPEKERPGAEQAAEKGLISSDVPKRDGAGAEARLVLLALSARLKSCPKKKQGCTFSRKGLRHPVLRTPTHRTKTKTSDGWGTVSSPVGRQSPWTTDTKPWKYHARTSFPQPVKPLWFGTDFQGSEAPCSLWKSRSRPGKGGVVRFSIQELGPCCWGCARCYLS
jgi:hypothetical protein